MKINIFYECENFVSHLFYDKIVGLHLFPLQSVCERQCIEVGGFSSIIEGKALCCLVDYYFRNEVCRYSSKVDSNCFSHDSRFAYNVLFKFCFFIHVHDFSRMFRNIRCSVAKNWIWILILLLLMRFITLLLSKVSLQYQGTSLR